MENKAQNVNQFSFTGEFHETEDKGKTKRLILTAPWTSWDRDARAEVSGQRLFAATVFKKQLLEILPKLKKGETIRVSGRVAPNEYNGNLYDAKIEVDKIERLDAKGDQQG